MKKESINQWFSRVFTRDINISKKSFGYLLFSLLAIMLIIEALIFEYIRVVNDLEATIEQIYIFVLILAISFLFSGMLVDLIKNRTQYYNLMLLIAVFGLLLSAIPENLFYYFGMVLVLLTTPQLIIVWFTILVHETNILNRGRITTYVFVPSFNLGFISLIFIEFDILYLGLGILEFFIFLIIFWYSRSYKYRETEERLQSEKKYLKIIFEKHFFRYSSSFTMLSITLGGLIERYTLNVDILLFAIISSFYLIVAGCFFDNIGRKISIVLGILVVSFFLISYGSFINEPEVLGMPIKVVLSIHYAFSLGPLLLAIFTIAGDFSTERGNLKFRGRINGIFMLLFFLGTIGGFMLSYWINAVIPNFANLLNSYILVILLVWMMGMKEFLASKEKKWAETLSNLLVFSKTGICLYEYDFEKKGKTKDKEGTVQFDRDLVSGVLSGVITIISEITNSKKELRKIDKEGVFLLFGYGRYHIVALIATMELPVLFKKLDEFSREFENKFSKDLKLFAGNVARFFPTKSLIKKYFKQKDEEVPN